MPRFRTGVAIGKFYPPHRGHHFLIEQAAAQVERLTVIVCDRAGQTIPGEVRAAWLRETHPDVRVLVIEDVYPPDDSELWARKTIEWLGFAPEAAFTSESYGPRYAGCMGALHISVDPARVSVPCSGTAVRADPFANWEFLEPCVRAYFALRICVVGAESTGTTTLAKALADRYQTEWVPEYGREYSELHKFRPGANWRSEEFVHIAQEQSRRENEAARRCNRLLICDTDALATSIWHERYMGEVSTEVLALGLSRAYAYYMVTDVDIPFVQDGFRDGEHMRHWMHERFCTELRRLGRPYVVVSGPLAMPIATSIRPGIATNIRPPWSPAEIV